MNVAVASPDSFWKFITSPQTSYFDREAAIKLGWRLISPEWIPKLVRARNELLREWNLHQFGVALSRFDAGGGRFPNDPRARIGRAIKRTILGHEFTVPARRIEYPETSKDRATSPWPFQVFYLIHGLYGTIGLYGQVIRNTAPTGLDRIVLNLPCDDYDSASALIEITLHIAESAHYVRPEIFATWLNALHNLSGTPSVERATLGIPFAAAKSIAPTQRDESWANLQILGLEALDTKDITQTVPVFQSIGHIIPIPNTLVLAAARYLEEAERVHRSGRELQAKALLEAMSPALSEPASRHSADSHTRTEEGSWIARFQSWFAVSRVGLEKGAVNELETINSARERLKNASGAYRP